MVLRLLLSLWGWFGFWQDRDGRWYGYPPCETDGYFSYEAERHPLPSLREFLKEIL